MNMLERYVSCMSAHDLKGIVDCWEDGGIFDDEAAKLLVGKPGYCVGKRAIRRTFRLMFLLKPKAYILQMSEDGKWMNYDIHIIGKVLRCRGTIEEEGADGKFKVYSCRPRNP